MVFFWAFVFLGLIYLDRVDRLRVDNIVQAHQFKLYTLRDDLRESAMNETVNRKSWVFQYLDSSPSSASGPSKTISRLERGAFPTFRLR